MKPWYFDFCHSATPLAIREDINMHTSPLDQLTVNFHVLAACNFCQAKHKKEHTNSLEIVSILIGSKQSTP